MRSLWSGVTGLQAHQIAMDVEGNNIANVNTVGYKYSRANFEDLIYQNSRVATSPQNKHGGVNGMQVGLGTQVQSTTKIFKQGSLQTTDKQTDIALQGDGFFMVSPDGGKSYYYTRNGDFSRDSQGNFVDNNGLVVQGWMRDEDTNEIDPTRPIENIVIPTGLTTPARATTEVTLVANLDSGNDVGTKKIPAYQLDQYHDWTEKGGDGIKSDTEKHEENNIGDSEFYVNKNNEQRLKERGVDLGVLFNANGDAYNIRDGQGIWVSYADAKTNPIDVGADVNGNFAVAQTLDITINGEQIKVSGIKTVSQLAAAIKEKYSKTGVEASVQGGNKIVLTNRNNTGTDIKTKNIKLTVNKPADGGTNTVGGFTDTNIITAYQYTYSKTSVGSIHTYNDEQARQVTTTEDLRHAMQTDARKWVNYAHTNVGNQKIVTNNGGVVTTTTVPDATVFTAALAANKNDGVEVTLNEYGQFQIKNPKGDAFNEDDGDATDGTTNGPAKTAAAAAINSLSNIAGVDPADLATVAAAINTAANEKNATPATVAAAVDAAIGAVTQGTPSATALNGGKAAAQAAANAVPQTTGQIDRADNDQDMYLTITGLTNAKTNITENSKFTASIAPINGSLNTGDAMRVSDSLNVAAHSSSTDIFDSLGTKHNIKMDFAKRGYTENGGTEWNLIIQVAEPNVINNEDNGLPSNVVVGYVRFNPDGSLATYSPASVTFGAKNGSSAGQTIRLNFGQTGTMTGVTSADNESSTKDISQDGYASGDLNGIRIDQSGTLIGSFTNGKSIGLAQVAVAKFANNAGLEAQGGNLFGMTPNSGNPIIGTAATAGRGSITASSLEMSNVDLSRSLTQLIVVQRGYQANSKTITTSDEMLNTLLQLK